MGLSRRDVLRGLAAAAGVAGMGDFPPVRQTVTPKDTVRPASYLPFVTVPDAMVELFATL